MTVGAIVTDIEGTTSSIAFVHEVLFPYASSKLADFVREHQAEPEIVAILADARREAGAEDGDLEALIGIMLGWIREDRKVTPLKTLQGHIWRHGYEAGDFTGHVYEDAARKLREWADDGVDLYVYSSGSVGAQKLLFSHSDAGDLTGLFRGYFDTRIGHKREVDSYREIARRIDRPAEEILFLSDVVEELDAAQDAGLQTLQLVRDDDVVTGSHPTAADFDAVMLDL